MAEWVHCNKCITRFHHSIKFQLVLNCGHILCEKCAARMQATDQKCLVCNESPSNVLLISPEMDDNTKMFFKPLDTTTDKLRQIWTFQSRNYSNMSKHMTMKYDHCKRELLKSLQKLNELNKENSRLRSMLQMSANVKGSGGAYTSTPAHQPNFSVASDFSMSVNNKFENSPNVMMRRKLPPVPGYPQRVEYTPSVASSASSYKGRGLTRQFNSREFLYTPIKRPSPAQVVPGMRPEMAAVHHRNRGQYPELSLHDLKVSGGRTYASK